MSEQIVTAAIAASGSLGVGIVGYVLSRKASHENALLQKHANEIAEKAAKVDQAETTMTAQAAFIERLQKEVSELDRRCISKDATIDKLMQDLRNAINDREALRMIVQMEINAEANKWWHSIDPERRERERRNDDAGSSEQVDGD